MIIVYSKPNCPYCKKAKGYLAKAGFDFKEINVQEDAVALDFIKNQQGHKTVPQIYYNDKLLVDGGYDGLKKLTPDQIRKKIQNYANQ